MDRMRNDIDLIIQKAVKKELTESNAIDDLYYLFNAYYMKSKKDYESRLTAINQLSNVILDPDYKCDDLTVNVLISGIKTLSEK